MKKTILFFVFLFLINSVLAVDIGYVVKNPNLNNNEKAVENFLENEGYIVSKLSESISNVDNYDLIIVSNSVKSISFDNKNKKTLFMSKSAVKNAGITNKYGGFTTKKYIFINRKDFITEEYLSEGKLEVYPTSSTIHYLTGISLSSTIKNLAYNPGSQYKIVILTIDKNIQYTERNVYFGLIDAKNWNDNAKNLFKRSVIWILNGGLVDNDKDGYNSIESGGDDCDDNDPDVNPGSDDPLKDCINTPPIIESYLPDILGNVKVLENTNKEFSIVVSDVDNNVEDLTITWFVNNNFAANGNNYSFNKEQGDYEVKVIVSDGENEVEHVWNVLVRGYGEFTCLEVNGFICSENKVCSEEILGVSDSSRCCAVECSEKPPEFSGISKTCENKNNNIEVTFIDLSENEEFKINNKIKFRMRVKNKLSENRNFNIKAYLYDLTNNKVIEKEKNNFNIKTGKFEYSDFEFLISENLDENKEYAVFVYIESNDLCNQDYKKIDINRKEHEVIIKSFDIGNIIFSCGDYIDSKVKINNIGNNNENVYIKIRSSELGINEKSEEFSIEKFGKDDSETKEMILKIRDDIEAGEYIIKGEVYFNNQVVSKGQTITLGECKLKRVKEKKADIVKLSGVLSKVNNTTKKIGFWDLIVILGACFVIGLVVYGIVIAWRKF